MLREAGESHKDGVLGSDKVGLSGVWWSVLVFKRIQGLG